MLQQAHCGGTQQQDAAASMLEGWQVKQTGQQQVWQIRTSAGCLAASTKARCARLSWAVGLPYLSRVGGMLLPAIIRGLFCVPCVALAHMTGICTAAVGLMSAGPFLCQSISCEAAGTVLPEVLSSVLGRSKYSRARECMSGSCGASKHASTRAIVHP